MSHAHDSMDFVPLAYAGEEETVSAINSKLRYVSLHHHSTFSYLDGFALPASHIERAADIGMGALALTEHGNVSSHVQLEVAARKAGVKPIFGCELYTGGVGEHKVQRKNHLTVLAENQQGYRNLLSIVTQGWSDFYYEPTVSGQVLAEHASGLLVLSGCTGSLLASSLVGGKNIPVSESGYEAGRAVAKKFKRTFGDAYYLEVQMFPELANVCKLNKMIAELSYELDIPLVATGDVHYTKPSENEMQQILHSVGRAKSLEQLAQDWGYDVPLCPPLNDAAVLKRLRGTGLSTAQARQALNNTAEVADRCNVTLPKLAQLKFPLPAGYTNHIAVWRQWIKEGWAFRKCNTLSKAELRRYKERLAYEMDIIEQKDFVDYFLVVSDMVKWSKENNVLVGPARGSAAASLVCWLLRITEVNPLLFDNLVFERFIDLSRADLPDIDLDFDSDKRDDVRHYLARKYGADCVGNIGTFTYFKSKNSLDDIARVYRIPKTAVDTVKELLVERSGGDLRADATIEDTVEQFDAARAVFEKYPDLHKAMELEGNIKGMGVHAAGIVIANGPLTDVCALYERKVGEKVYQVISLDKYDAERQNLLKIDALGLSTMTVIAEALAQLGMTIQDLYDLTFDDPEVIAAFNRNDCTGIFQFDGITMRQVTRELKPDNFQEVCDINALARPGPLYNGATANYINIKWGRMKHESLHPLLDEITKGTHNQIVYQEQILRIVREIGNFDWTHAAYIRKIISKKLGKQEFERQFSNFQEGSRANGIDDETSREIWNKCVTAGAYAFNAAHCVSYGILAYWTMWIKVNHPAVFYSSSLNHLNSDKKLEILKDAERHGLSILPPDPAVSRNDWEPVPGGIRGGLTTVKGVGEKVAAAIVQARSEGTGIYGWDDLVMIKGIGNKTVDACKNFCAKDDPYDIHKLERQIEELKEELWKYEAPMPTHTSEQIPFSEEAANTPVVWVGVVKYRNQRNLFEAHFSRTGEELDPATVKNPELAEWVTAMGADDTDVTTLVWNRWKYQSFKDQIFNIKLDHDLIVVEGVKYGFQARRAIYINRMWVFDPGE